MTKRRTSGDVSVQLYVVFLPIQSLNLNFQVREGQRLALEIFWCDWGKKCDLHRDFAVNLDGEDALGRGVFEGDLISVGRFDLNRVAHPGESVTVYADQTGPSKCMSAVMRSVLSFKGQLEQ